MRRLNYAALSTALRDVMQCIRNWKLRFHRKKLLIFPRIIDYRHQIMRES